MIISHQKVDPVYTNLAICALDRMSLTFNCRKAINEPGVDRRRTKKCRTRISVFENEQAKTRVCVETSIVVIVQLVSLNLSGTILDGILQPPFLNFLRPAVGFETDPPGIFTRKGSTITLLYGDDICETATRLTLAALGALWIRNLLPSLTFISIPLTSYRWPGKSLIVQKRSLLMSMFYGRPHRRSKKRGVRLLPSQFQIANSLAELSL